MSGPVITIDFLVAAVLALCCVWGGLLLWAIVAMVVEQARTKKARRLDGACSRCPIRHPESYR